MSVQNGDVPVFDANGGNPVCVVQPSQKEFRIKKKLAKKARQNRPIPPWIRFRTNNTIRCVGGGVWRGGGRRARCFGEVWKGSPGGQGRGTVLGNGACRCAPSCSCVVGPGHTDAHGIRILDVCRYNAKRRHWRRTKLGL